MARANDIYRLAAAALGTSRPEIISAARALAANEPANSGLRVRLEQALARHGDGVRDQAAVLGIDPKVAGLVKIVRPDSQLDDLVLPGTLMTTLLGLMREQRAIDLLDRFRIPPRHTLLLSGEPGTGKTSLAYALAGEMDRPLAVIDYARVIGSHLGETGANLAKVFRALRGADMVILLDELDTVLSERAGSSRDDVGEQARIVSTLLLEIDDLPPHTILVGATNHVEMLDRAVRRRFDVQQEMPLAGPDAVARLQDRFLATRPELPREALAGINLSDFDPAGVRFSDVEQALNTAARNWVLSQPGHVLRLEP